MQEPTPTLGPQPTTLPEEEGADLRQYLALLRGHRLSIAVITLVTVAAALFFSFRQTPIYESEAQVLVNPIPLSGFSAAPPPVPNLDTERTIAVSREVGELAVDQLGGALDPDDLLEDLAVEVATNSEVLIFRYSDPRPLEAQRRAQAFADAYLSFRREKALESVALVQESIQQEIDDVSAELGRVNRQLVEAEDEVQRANLQTRASGLAAQLAVREQQLSQAASVGQLQVGEVIAEADLPASPASPNHILNGALALLVGLALGVGFAFLRERLDDRLRGQGDLESRVGAPVLAVVPRVAGWKKSNETPMVTLTDPRSGAAEAYRTLRTGLLFAAAERGVRTVLVTSPHPGEGKTATAANLAVVLSQAGRRVIVVSADLRKPRLHRFFGEDNKAGLSRLLTGEDQFRDAVRDVGLDALRVVPSGPVPKNPAELLGSHAMAKALERFREAADLVLIDGPPVLDVADTITMVPFVDAVVLVADAEKTSRAALSHARKQLDQVRAEVMGAVLNNLDPTKARSYYYPYYYRYGYQYRDGPPEPRGRRGAAEEEAWTPVTPPSAPRATPAPPTDPAQPAPQATPEWPAEGRSERSIEDLEYEELLRSIDFDEVEEPPPVASELDPAPREEPSHGGAEIPRWPSERDRQTGGPGSP